ncbi:MAG: hypothetical protein C4534_00225 [Gaiellales bacterium]|nr:MAG: hypothetical protein C4534_00225 [Gaiellales bacterium]
MGKTAKKLAKLARGELEPGEEIIAGLRVNLKGTALGTGLAVGLGGIGGIALGSKLMSRGQENAADAGIEFSQQMSFGLTDRRIIIWKRSPASGKTKEVIGSIPLEEIEGVSFQPGKLGDRLTLVLSGGRELTLEAARVDKGQEFADRLQVMVA